MSSVSLHPTPLLAREGWLDLRGLWEFAFDDADAGREEGWQRQGRSFPLRIQVPFPPESPASGIGDPSFHPVVWYRRAVQLHGAPGERFVLHFGAVDYRAEVWVNGLHVARHEGGHTPFAADITDTVRGDGAAVITVRVEDRPEDLAQPRGKQDWLPEPHDIWYQRTTGIWQAVWIETVHPVHITRLQWSPQARQGALELDLSLSRFPGEPVRLRVEIASGGSSLVDDVYTLHTPHLTRRITLIQSGQRRDELLWSPDNPVLLDVTITVVVGDTVVDQVTSYAGLRDVDLRHGRFLLNGMPRYLRLALSQGYWPQSHLAAPDDDALRREVELTRALGFNGLRLHQKVEDPRFLYWCDRLGLMVWGELPSAYVFSRESVARLTREWQEVLERDRSHPSIIAWVPLNESWGVPDLAGDPAQRDFVRSLYYLTRTIDPSRPVVANDGWEWFCGDVLGLHDYSPSGQIIRQRYGSREAVSHTVRAVPLGMRAAVLEAGHESLPLILSEIGGLYYPTEPGTAIFAGYGAASTPEELLSRLREIIWAVLDCAPTAGFCYTQLTDTAQERNGLLDENRVPKLDPALVRQVVQRPSAALAAHLLTQPASHDPVG